jgi:hypothetical protein
MPVEIATKADVTAEAVRNGCKDLGLDIPADRIENLAERLRDLFDLAQPLHAANVDIFEPGMPFDPRWTSEERA